MWKTVRKENQNSAFKSWGDKWLFPFARLGCPLCLAATLCCPLPLWFWTAESHTCSVSDLKSHDRLQILRPWTAEPDPKTGEAERGYEWKEWTNIVDWLSQQKIDFYDLNCNSSVFFPCFSISVLFVWYECHSSTVYIVLEWNGVEEEPDKNKTTILYFTVLSFFFSPQITLFSSLVYKSILWAHPKILGGQIWKMVTWMMFGTSCLSGVVRPDLNQQLPLLAVTCCYTVWPD